MDTEDAELAPLMFLEGNWKGEGVGPYGPYQLEAIVELRGRWLLLTHAIMDSQSQETSYVSTQVYGYDDTGLTLHYFDTAGSFHFKGKTTDDGLLFDFKDGENWKRSHYWVETNGKIKFRYESVYPKDGSEVFEGHWTKRSNVHSKGEK